MRTSVARKSDGMNCKSRWRFSVSRSRNVIVLPPC
jgi:hypothetical protein